MVKKLGNFEIISQVRPGGYSIVYKARQDLGMGVSRPAAIKVLEGWQVNNDEQMEELRREVSLMVQFSSSPYIVQVWESGLEPGLGPWVAMEFLGTSLKNAITDAPIEPEKVRQLLHDVLNGLVTIQELAPDTIHRDIKPNNILLGLYGAWKIADFGLARIGAADDTLKKVAVQYAAPELLDAQRGTVGAWTDLYALGMSAYHYALGHTLFRQQFPAIYSDSGGKPSDERPKWMFWHTSQQTLKPVAELLPGFPIEISNLIAALTAKDPAKRPQTAKDAIAQLGARGGAGVVNVDAAKLAMVSERPAHKPVISKPVAGVLVVMGVLAVVVGIAAFVLNNIQPPPEVVFESQGKFSTGSDSLRVAGSIVSLPPGTTGMLTLANGDEFPLRIGESGTFTADVRMPRVGTQTGTLQLLDAERNPLPTSGQSGFSIERVPPREVEVVVNLSPLIEHARVSFVTAADKEGTTQTTGEQGQARARLPRGKFDLVIEHPRYVPYRQSMETGDDLSRAVRVPMRLLTNQEIEARRQALLAQVQTAALLAAQGDQQAVAKLRAIQAELGLLEPEGSRKRDPMADVMALIGTKGVGDTDRSRLQQALADLATGASGGSSTPVGTGQTGNAPGVFNRQAAVAGSADLTAAQANVALANRRVELVNEMESLQARAAAGDPYAKQRLKDIAAELADIESRTTGPKSAADQRRADLLQEYQRVAALAANGDPEAIKRLTEIQKELSTASHAALDTARDRERSVSSALAAMAGLDPMAIMKMSIAELRGFLSRQAPLDSLALQDMPEINRVRVSGPVLSARELQNLMIRLAPANERIVPELAVDPLAVCKRIEKALTDAGAEAPRVRAAITQTDELVYVQFDGNERFTASQARSIAARYVLNPDSLVVQDNPPKAAKPDEKTVGEL